MFLLKDSFKKLNHYRVIHSVKTAIGCLIGLFVSWYYNLPQGQWIPITVIVVMSAQTHFGGALQKAYMRFLGTISGVLITVITLLLFHQSAASVFTSVFLACLIFTYIASGGGAISYAGALGGVTVVLTLGGANSGVLFAVQRGCYIVLGIIIALLVSRFIFPIHARDQLRLSVAASLRNLRELYFRVAQGNIFDTEKRFSKDIDNVLMKAFSEQPQLIAEAASGSRYFRTHKKELFIEAVKIERKLYRLIYFMRRILKNAKWFDKFIKNVGEMEALHIAIESNLEILADCFEKTAPCVIPKQNKVDELLQKLDIIVKTLPKEEKTEKIIDEHSFLFFMEQIAKEIEKLQNVAKKISL